MTTLETLLVAIRDGTAPPDALDRARKLAERDARIPEDLRDVVLIEPSEASSDAAGLLAVLGADDIGEILSAALLEESGLAPQAPEVADPDLDDEWAPIGAALREGLLAEAEGVEVVDAVMRRIPLRDFPWGPVLAGAVTNEAGSADVAPEVLSLLPFAEAPPVAAAVRAAAGRVEIADSVMQSLGLSRPLPIAEAVRASAGSIDITARVMLQILPEAHTPAPANRRYAFVSLLLAAVALLVVVATGRLAGSGLSGETLRFARASEVIVEDLNYANDVQVMVIEGDDGAVILWFDEEA